MADSVETPAADVLPYLKQVRVRDYPPLRDAKVDFKPGLNIIIGKNGAGKTRFLTLTNKLLRYSEVVYEGANCELLLNFGDDVQVQFRQPMVVEKIKHLHHRMQLIEEYGLDVWVTHKDKREKGDSLDLALWDAGIDAHLLPEPVLAKHGIPLQDAGLSDIPVTVTVDILKGRIQVEPKPRRYNADERILLTDSIFITLGLSFLWRYRKGNPSLLPLTAKEGREVIENVVNAFLKILNPLIALYSPITQIRLSEVYQAYDNTSQQEIIIKGLVFEYQLGESWLPFSVLSDGTKRMLYLITQLVMPAAHFDEKRPLPMPFILETIRRPIFLEEPELGIHPDQLQKLLSLIREVSKEHQVIMTTHSPQVLNMLTTKELDRITICELDPEKGTQFRKLSPAKRAKAKAYMQNDSYLSDFWLYSNLEAE